MQSLQGIVRGTMLFDDAMHFMLLGVMLERAGQTARILDVHHHAFQALGTHEVIETALWLALLRACSGFEPFMKVHRGRVSPAAVARFLVVDPHLPPLGPLLAAGRGLPLRADPPARAGRPPGRAQRGAAARRWPAGWRRWRRTSTWPGCTSCSPTWWTRRPRSRASSEPSSWGMLRRPAAEMSAQ